MHHANAQTQCGSGPRPSFTHAAYKLRFVEASGLTPPVFNHPREGDMLGTILIVILILLLIGSFPAWPYSRGWGYGPTGGLGLIVVIVVILVLLGRI